MKKNVILFSLLAGIFTAGLTFAEELPTDSSDDTQQQKQPHEQQGMMGGRGMSMKGQMMKKGMHQPSMIATSDGGLVILSGNKLTKYNAALDIVKEVELKRPSPPMKKQSAPESDLPDDMPAELSAPADFAPVTENATS